MRQAVIRPRHLKSVVLRALPQMLGLQACTMMLGTEPKVLFKDGEILPTLVVRVQHQEMLSGE